MTTPSCSMNRGTTFSQNCPLFMINVNKNCFCTH